MRSFLVKSLFADSAVFHFFFFHRIESIRTLIEVRQCTVSSIHLCQVLIFVQFRCRMGALRACLPYFWSDDLTPLFLAFFTRHLKSFNFKERITILIIYYKLLVTVSSDASGKQADFLASSPICLLAIHSALTFLF